jgi:ankyrin repeat protein
MGCIASKPRVAESERSHSIRNDSSALRLAPPLSPASSFQPHYSVEDALSLHALSFTTGRNDEDSLVNALLQRTSEQEDDLDGAVIELCQLIDAGIPLDKPDEKGDTPLHLAARGGLLVMMEQLLASGVPVDRINFRTGDSALHDAAMAGKSECVASLLQHSSSLVGVANMAGDLPLHKAAAAGHEECVRCMLLGDPAALDLAVSFLNSSGLSPVHLAAQNGRLGVLQRMYTVEMALLPRPVGSTVVSIQDATGKTALTHAVIAGQGDIVQMLLMRGADPNVQDAVGRTPVHYAVLSLNASIMQSLLECGGDPTRTDDDGYTPFCYCSMQEGADSLVGLLAECLMFCSIETGSVSKVQQAMEQIEHCSSLRPIELKDFSGNRPMHVAARVSVDLVRFFMDRAGYQDDLRIENDVGDLPIHVACRSGKLHCVDAFLSADRRLGGIATPSGDTCLHIAARSGHTDLISLLASTYELPTEARNRHDNTPLHEAVGAMQYEPIKALWDAGADLHAVDGSGCTAMDLLGEGGLFEDSRLYQRISSLLGDVPDKRSLSSDSCPELIWLSSETMLEEEMDSMDIGCGLENLEDKDRAGSSDAKQFVSRPGAPNVVKARAEAQRTVRLLQPTVASPFGAMMTGEARGFQKFSSSIKRNIEDPLASSSPSSKLFIEPEHIQVFKNHVLGEGSFGLVYLGVLHGNKVAVKVFKMQKSYSFKNSPSEEGQQFLDELEAMADLRHDNIQSVRGYTVLPEGRAIVSAYYDRGSLLNILQKAARNQSVANQLTWCRRLKLAGDIVKAMMAMHNHNPPRVHRDLKAANCFVDASWTAYLGDFGFACYGESSCDNLTRLGPTNPRWLAPEELVSDHSASTAASDVYSFGMLLYEILTWKPPFADKGTATVYNLVNGGRRPSIPENIEQLPGNFEDNLAFEKSGALRMYVNIMTSCWAQTAASRIPTNQLYGELRAVERTFHRVEQ